MNSYSLESSVGSIQNIQSVHRYELLLGAPGSFRRGIKAFSALRVQPTKPPEPSSNSSGAGAQRSACSDRSGLERPRLRACIAASLQGLP